MITANYKCNICSFIFEVTKNGVEEDFPSSIKCPICLNLDTYRVWSMPLTSVAEGELGNSKNNYEKSMIYHPASLTGYVKGKTIKTIK
jgi:rubredoxin